MSWPKVKFGSVCSVVTKGTTPTSIGYDFSEEGIPFLRVQNIKNSTVSLDDVLFIDQNTHDALERSKIKAGDLLVTIAGTIGRVAVVPEAFPEANCNQAVAIIRFDKSKFDIRFLLHWLGSDEAIRQISGKKVTGTISNLSLSQIKELEIPLPPLEEQKRLAAILDKADAICQKRKQAIELADEFLRSVFLDMFGDIRQVVESTVEELAENRKGSMRTGPFGSQLLHSEFTQSGVSVLGIDNAVKNSFEWGKERFISQEKYSELSRYTVLPGDVLITIMGTCGRCAVVPQDIPLAINTKHLCCITLDKSKCLPEFLHSYFLYHPIARRYLEKNTKGAIMSGLNMGIIKAMPIPVFPLSMQKKYVEITQMTENLKHIRKDIEMLGNENFNALSQKAFLGQL
ncbi:restriction endonuclease subunit S [Aliivibrio sp. S3MY1]|uniref:restriction endonuclease subunit S n=1 Tax=unclassified Aliivibrio TaxID=2645654 RepID=UPI00237905F8|nr:MULTISPECIES: restriction endonuclease subunit S [unclassified Aliivibrio]MDD9194252.1 restriction endonuclease subunit S [Aliivibrio sp. S3MY1]MDD9197919.1 restriction endonuclease subunit S [Aliivibrio sp. S2MY1]